MSTASKRTVDFLLAGSTKSGTSSVHEYFRHHPDVGVPSIKEPHYFSMGLFGPNYEGFGKEMHSPDQWRKLYAHVPEGKIIGDCDPLTLHGPRAPELVYEANPNAKIMMILRNPIDRAYSHYLMDVRECVEPRTFMAAVKEDYRKYRSGSGEFSPVIRLGFYSDPILGFLKKFGRSQIRIWLYDELCRDQQKVYREMCDFIGVEYQPVKEGMENRENVAAVPRSRLSAALLRARFGPLRKPRELYIRLPAKFRKEIKERLLIRRINVRPMAPDARQLLVDIYRNEIFALQKLLECDLTHWLRDPATPLLLPDDLQLEQKAKQAEYFDSAVDAEFEIERPAGTGRLYSWSIESKFDKAASMLSFPLYGVKLLDICCGSGLGAEKYATRGAMVTGVDISEQSLERARERARRHQFEAHFVLGDAEKLPFPDKSFDLVTVHDGLHHLPNPHAAIAEMARVAERAIIIIEPARSWLTRRAVGAKLALDYEDAGNFVYRFREPEIYKIAAAAGFRTFKVQQYLLYYRHEPFRWAKYIENTPLFFLPSMFFKVMSLIAPRLGNKLCVVCERG